MPKRVPLVLAIDQGTSATKALVLDGTGVVVAQASHPLTQHYPQPGWVEQSPARLLNSVHATVQAALDGLDRPIAAIGLSTQRESAIAWDRRTGEPMSPVLGWQDRRTVPDAQRLAGEAEQIRQRTGLPLDPMFSALKFAWLRREGNLPHGADVVFGTVDAWLIARLTGETRIEIGNASRTQLMDVSTGAWDETLLDLFGVPSRSLPEIRDSDAATTAVRGIPGLDGVPVTGILGDSHAALYGHGARTAGQVKATYGTGSSIMGILPVDTDTDSSLTQTVAWRTHGETTPAFEGNILSSGATMTWLASILGVTVAEAWQLAEQVDDSGTVHLVPAFAGLGAPWWDEQAQATMNGMTLGSTPAELAHAAASSICYQIEDVLAAADAVTGSRIDEVLTDGGPSANAWLMQLQADISQRTVRPAAISELSAFGAAQLAAESTGLGPLPGADAEGAHHPPVLPNRSSDWADAHRARWLDAVRRARQIG